MSFHNISFLVLIALYTYMFQFEIHLKYFGHLGQTAIKKKAKFASYLMKSWDRELISLEEPKLHKHIS